MKRSILSSFLVIGAVSALIFAATTAVFDDTVTSDDNTFETGTLLLSVDDNCGTTDANASEAQDRTTGSDTACERGVAFSQSNMAPGDSENHDFAIRNDGSIDGELSITVNATSTGSCNVDVNPTTPAAGWVVTYDEISAEALAANTSRASDWNLNVELNDDAGNECQATELDIDVTFFLDQDVS